MRRTAARGRPLAAPRRSAGMCRRITAWRRPFLWLKMKRRKRFGNSMLGGLEANFILLSVCKRALTDRRSGRSCLAAVRRFEEVHAGGTVLRVGLQLVFDVGGWAFFGAAFEELHCATATHAAELG